MSRLSRISEAAAPLKWEKKSMFPIKWAGNVRWTADNLPHEFAMFLVRELKLEGADVGLGAYEKLEGGKKIVFVAADFGTRIFVTTSQEPIKKQIDFWWKNGIPEVGNVVDVKKMATTPQSNKYKL